MCASLDHIQMAGERESGPRDGTNFGDLSPIKTIPKSLLVGGSWKNVIVRFLAEAAGASSSASSSRRWRRSG